MHKYFFSRRTLRALAFTGIFFFLSCLMMTAQNKREVMVKYLDSNIRFTRKANAAYQALAIKDEDHWQLIAIYPDSSLLLRMYFKDRSLTIKDGPCSIHYSNGKKAMEGYYVNNSREGIWKSWYPSGMLKDSGMVTNDACAGPWKGWHENGALGSETNYLQKETSDQAAPPGDMRFSTEQHLLEGVPFQGTLHGNFRTYSVNGQTKEKGSYALGQKTGKWEFFYPNGGIECQGTFATDLQTGLWEYFHANGKCSTKETYENGQLTSLACYDTLGTYTGDFCSIQKPAVAVLERYTEFTSYMYEQLHWPVALEGREANGIVRVEFTISKAGSLQNIRILESPHVLISQEVTRFLESIPSWSPAISHNRPIDFSQTLRIPFYR